MSTFTSHRAKKEILSKSKGISAYLALKEVVASAIVQRCLTWLKRVGVMDSCKWFQLEVDGAKLAYS